MYSLIYILVFFTKVNIFANRYWTASLYCGRTVFLEMNIVFCEECCGHCTYLVYSIKLKYICRVSWQFWSHLSVCTIVFAILSCWLFCNNATLQPMNSSTTLYRKGQGGLGLKNSCFQQFQLCATWYKHILHWKLRKILTMVVGRHNWKSIFKWFLSFCHFFWKEFKPFQRHEEDSNFF